VYLFKVNPQIKFKPTIFFIINIHIALIVPQTKHE
jgi:hypothetical protein